MPFFGGSSVGTTVEVSEIESLAKGALIVGDGSGAPTALGVGTDTHVLVADAAQSVGIKWAALSGYLQASNNLSDLADASTARTNLGVAIGSNVQAYSAMLAAVAGLAATGLMARTGAGTASARTITGTADRLTVTNGDGVSGNPTLDVGANVYTAGGTDVPVTDGGTGASDASGARTNLGVAIGSDVQAYSALLAAIVALGTNGIVAKTAAGTAAARTITGTASEITVTNGDGVSGNPTLALHSGVYRSGGTDVAIADGGTGASTASDAFSNLKQAASDSATGVVELATAAETTTGTDTARAVTPDGLAGSDYGKRVVTLLVTDPNGDAITTGDGKAYWRVPNVMNGYNLVAVAAHVTTASSSGTPTIQIHNVTQAADMLSTRVTIDANEKDSSTAAAAAAIDAANDDVATGDEIRIDIDTAGTGTKGLMVEMQFQLP